MKNTKKEYKNQIVTDEQKVEVLLSFYDWSGGFIPSQHHWDDEDGSPGLHFFIEDNSNLVNENTDGLTDWFNKLDTDIQDTEIKELVKNFKKLKTIKTAL